MRNCYIVSLKYAPGLAKEFFLLGEKLKSVGYRVSYLLSDSYDDRQEADVYHITSSVNVRQVVQDSLLFSFKKQMLLKRILEKLPPDLVLIYNPHPLNAEMLRMAAKVNPGCKRVLFLHEPYKEDKASFGIKGRIIYKYLESSLKKTLRFCTDVIVPSQYALEIYSRNFSCYSAILHQCPLLVPDMLVTEKSREAFSMVGRINYTKKLDEFINLVDYCSEEGLEFEFKVTTPSDIRADLKELSGSAMSHLKTLHSHMISDEQINNAISESYAVFCLHKNVVQSGVIPTAYMNSTPVIVRNEPGFTQHVTHKENGYILPNDYLPVDMVDAMTYVKQNIAEMAVNARKTYLEVFSPDKWKKYYDWI